MRMTVAHIRAITDAIQVMTAGERGRVQFGQDYSGRGTRVISMDKWEVWFGRNSLRRAAAYYLGFYDRLGGAGDMDTPDKIAEALYVVTVSGLYDGEDYLRGVVDAADYLNKFAQNA